MPDYPPYDQNQAAVLQRMFPATPANAATELWKMTGIPDIQQGAQAWQRGEYLPGFGQMAAGAAQIGGLAAPMARGAVAAGREALGAVPGVMGDITGAMPRLAVRPASEDVGEVINANFTHGRDLGPKTVSLSSLNGGVDLAQPSGKRRVDALAADISGPNGYISRPIVDTEGNVIEGQHRIEALRQLGVQRIPVHVVEDIAKGIDVTALRDAIRAAQPMHRDQAYQLSQHLLEAAAEHGSPRAAQVALEPPNGYEVGWNAGLSFLAPPSGIRGYHGSPSDFEAFDPSASKPGFYGRGAYFHKDEKDALKHKFTSEDPVGGKMYEANIATSRPFDMQKPVSAEDAAQILEALGKPDQAQTVRQSGNGYRTGSEFWYWGTGQNTPNDARAKAVRDAGFDAIIGNPNREMTGNTRYSDIVNVLDPSIIKILRKYGLAGLLAGGAATTGGSANAAARLAK